MMCSDCVVVSRKPDWCCLRSQCWTTGDHWSVGGVHRWRGEREPSLATPLLPTVRTPAATGRHRHTDLETYTTTTLPLPLALPPTPTKENTDRETGCNQGLSARTPRDRLRPSQTCLFYSEMREMTRLSTVHSLVHFNNLTSSSIVTAK